MTTIDFNSTSNASETLSENETTLMPDSQQGYSCFIRDAMSTKVARVFAYCVVILISTLGNSMTIVVVWRDKTMRKVAFNFLIVNMAVADLIITLVYMTRLIVMWLRGTEWFVGGVFGSVLCKISPSLHVVSILVSILTLLALAVDRFIAIVFPWRQKLTVKSCKFLIAFIWVLAITVRIPYIWSLKILFKETRRGFVCGANTKRVFGNSESREIYNTFLMITFYGLPFLVTIACYSMMVVSLRRQEPLCENTSDGAAERRDKASRKVFYMLLSVTAAFVFCWLAYFIGHIVFDSMPCNFRFWRLFLAHSNSAVNSCLYAVFNQTFRQGYKRLLSSMFCNVRAATRIRPLFPSKQEPQKKIISETLC